MVKEGKPSSIKARDSETVKLERSDAFDIQKVKLIWVGGGFYVDTKQKYQR